MEVDRLVHLYQEGKSLKTIAGETGIPPSTLSRRLRAAGVLLRPAVQKKQIDLPMAIHMHDNGHSQLEISEALGVSYQTIGRRLRENGRDLKHDHKRAGLKVRATVAAYDDQQLRQLRDQSMSTYEIAQVLGKNPETVRTAMARRGIDRLEPKARQEKNYFWAGGYTVDRDGYILQKISGHPHANSGGYVRQHRIVMEDKLERLLHEWEVVDHVNGDKSDNRPENLRLFGKNSEHLRATLTGMAQLPADEREELRLQAVQCAKKRVRSILGGSGTDVHQSPSPGPRDWW